MELSRRLQAVADLVCNTVSGNCERVVADVGTDHGYIPIYLAEIGRCDKIFAMDVNKGPLLRAKEHIEQHHLQEKIETRLSDGVQALQVGECDHVIVAGMGGALTIKIVTEGEDVFRGLTSFVLQPQSEIYKVRKYLNGHGYRIVAEDMVLEDGKFYPMMRVENGASDPYSEIELAYGICLLADRHPVLKLFLEKELQTKPELQRHLERSVGEQAAIRKHELSAELAMIREALAVYL